MLIRVAAVDDVPERRGLPVQIGEHAVVLFRIGSQVHALRDRCPHAGAPLNIGRLCGIELTCARHGWTFDVTTGESIPHDPLFDIPRYAVTITAGAVFLEIPDSPERD